MRMSNVVLAALVLCVDCTRTLQVRCMPFSERTVGWRPVSVPPPQQFDSPTVARSLGFLCLVVCLPHPHIALESYYPSRLPFHPTQTVSLMSLGPDAAAARVSVRGFEAWVVAIV